jgi:hypothetical protein
LSGIITDHELAKFFGSVIVTSYFSVSLSSGVMRSTMCISSLVATPRARPVAALVPIIALPL